MDALGFVTKHAVEKCMTDTLTADAVAALRALVADLERGARLGAVAEDAEIKRADGVRQILEGSAALTARRVIERADLIGTTGR